MKLSIMLEKGTFNSGIKIVKGFKVFKNSYLLGTTWIIWYKQFNEHDPSCWNLKATEDLISIITGKQYRVVLLQSAIRWHEMIKNNYESHSTCQHCNSK